MHRWWRWNLVVGQIKNLINLIELNCLEILVNLRGFIKLADLKRYRFRIGTIAASWSTVILIEGIREIEWLI